MIAYAFRGAGKQSEEITPEYVNAAKQALFYILQNSSNRGVNLWLLENIVLGAQSNQQILTMPEGTIDVREANWVYVQTPQISEALPADNLLSPVVFDGNLNGFATTTVSENWFGAFYAAPTSVYYVGFNAYAPNNGTATYTDMVYETSEDGITWVQQAAFDPVVTAQDRTWTYIPVNITQTHYYHRVRSTAAAAFSVRQIVFTQSQQVIPLARLNRDDYWNLPNKQFPSVRSLQYWFNRQIDPEMYLWPVPSNDFQVFQLIIEKQMMDVGSLTNQLYLPNRWIPYIQAALTHELALQLPGVDTNRINYLEKRALDFRTQAEEEDRDKSPIYFQPNYSYYTR
jgi:hypothetical protein